MYMYTLYTIYVCMLVATTAMAMIVRMSKMMVILCRCRGIALWCSRRSCKGMNCILATARRGFACSSSEMEPHAIASGPTPMFARCCIETVFDWISTASQWRRFLSVTRQLGHRSPHLRGRIHMFERNIRCSGPSSPRMNSRLGMPRAELLSAVPHWLATVAVALCRCGAYRSC